MTGDEPTPDSGLRVILAVLLKPSGNFSVSNLKYKSKLTSE